MTLYLWKGKDIWKICVIDINIKQEQMQWWILCVILTATVLAESCGTIDAQDVIKHLRIKNAVDGRKGIKEYPTEENEDFWMIKDNMKILYIWPIRSEWMNVPRARKISASNILSCFSVRAWYHLMLLVSSFYLGKMYIGA